MFCRCKTFDSLHLCIGIDPFCIHVWIHFASLFYLTYNFLSSFLLHTVFCMMFPYISHIVPQVSAAGGLYFNLSLQSAFHFLFFFLYHYSILAFFHPSLSFPWALYALLAHALALCLGVYPFYHFFCFGSFAFVFFQEVQLSDQIPSNWIGDLFNFASLVEANTVSIFFSGLFGQSEPEDGVIPRLTLCVLIVNKLSKMDLFELDDEIKACYSSVEDAGERESGIEIIEGTGQVDSFESPPSKKTQADLFEQNSLLSRLPEVFPCLNLGVLIQFVPSVGRSLLRWRFLGFSFLGRLFLALSWRGSRLFSRRGFLFAHSDLSQIQKNIKQLTLVFLQSDNKKVSGQGQTCQQSTLKSQIKQGGLYVGWADKMIQYCNFGMFQGQRLAYVVPGYTGHIPKKVYEDVQPIDKQDNLGKIPGYAGYVQAIKPQNLYGNTFGKTTLDVNNQQFVKGQDLEAKHKYNSSHTAHYIPPSERLQRTAADIVGVPNTKIIVPEPTIVQPGKEVDQFTLSKANNFSQTVKGKDAKWGESKVVDKNGKEYVELSEPLPGYTGFGKRVLANNIFGKTYAECLKESKRDDSSLQHEKHNHYQQQLASDVPFKF